MNFNRAKKSHMKTIYLARHGESESNTGPVRALPLMPLTARGAYQAEQLAKRCAKLPVDIILASTTARALETAKKIAAFTRKPLESSDLFTERRKPSEQNGKPKGDLNIVRIDRIIRENFHIPGFRYSDEENFEDLKARASAALTHLQIRREQHILVVTHGIVIRLLIARAIMGEGLTGLECESFIRSLRMENTGISVLGLNDNLEEEGVSGIWQLWAWNDFAHLR